MEQNKMYQWQPGDMQGLQALLQAISAAQGKPMGMAPGATNAAATAQDAYGRAGLEAGIGRDPGFQLKPSPSFDDAKMSRGDFNELARPTAPRGNIDPGFQLSGEALANAIAVLKGGQPSPMQQMPSKPMPQFGDRLSPGMYQGANGAQAGKPRAPGAVVPQPRPIAKKPAAQPDYGFGPGLAKAPQPDYGFGPSAGGAGGVQNVMANRIPKMKRGK